jgi:alpha,alpha-trehalase
MEGAGQLQPGLAHRRVVALRDGALLNRYWDDSDNPRDESYREDLALAARSGRERRQLFRDVRAAAESGWDFSSRWFGDGRRLETIRTTELIPVDLNSLLYGLETAIGAGCARAGDSDCAREFQVRQSARRRALDRYLWDASAGIYRDYDWTRQATVPRLSAATVYPLFTGAASDRQAAAVARALERHLLRAGGIVATPVRTGQQWDAPNGWAPLQWIAVSGLRRYTLNGLATRIASRWLRNVDGVYRGTRRLTEKYNVVAAGRGGGGGEYPLQDGFGWTNGVTRRLATLYPEVLAQSALREDRVLAPPGTDHVKHRGCGG